MGEKLRGIYKRGKTFWLRWTISGIQHRASLETEELHVAVEKAEGYRSSPALSGVIEWQHELQAYLVDRIAAGKLRPQTIEVRKYVLTAFFRHAMADSAARVKPAQVKAYYALMQKKGSEATAQSTLFALRAFFGWLVDKKKIRTNPALGIEPRRLPPPRRRWFASSAQVRNLLNNCTRDDLRFFLYCGLRAGMRSAEILQARRSWFTADSVHVQDDPKSGWVPKDRDNRTIPLSRDFAAFLSSWEEFQALNPDSYVLHPAKAQGRARLRWDPRRPFADYVKAQGCPNLTPHGMRTTFASLHVQAGTSPYKVAVWTGDRVDVLQKHYAHLLPSHDPAIDLVG